MKSNVITNILVTILLLLVIVLIAIQLKQYDVIDIKIKAAITSSTPDAPKNGYTPIKGIDYFDGKTPVKNVDYFDGISVKGDVGDRGEKGEKGDSAYESWLNVGNKGSEADFIEYLKAPMREPAVDGLTPELRCNTVKNRWEVRYSTTTGYKVLNGTPTPCTIESL